MAEGLAVLLAVCEKASRSKFPVTIDPVSVLPVVRRAADLIDQQAASLAAKDKEIERLRAGINGVVNFQSGMTRSQVRESCAEILDNKTIGLNNQSPFAEAMLGYKRALAEAVALIQQGESATNAAYSQAMAEYHGHDKTADKHDRTVTAFRHAARAFVAQHGSDSREGK